MHRSAPAFRVAGGASIQLGQERAGSLANGGAAITGTRPYYEITPAITYYFKGHDMKIVADAPVLIDVPVINEYNVGSYVITEQPDQVTYLTAGQGTIRRQVVPEARLMFQIAF